MTNIQSLVRSRLGHVIDFISQYIGVLGQIKFKTEEDAFVELMCRVEMSMS